MIISLRATSGGGKSHLVRRVTSLYQKHRSVYTDGRLKPLYEVHGRNPAGRCLVTPGHYLIANGGIDTLKDLDKAYHIARWGADSQHDVLMEGKNMSDGVQRVNELVDAEYDVRVVVINTPVGICIKSVRDRGHKIAEKSIERTHAKVMRDAVNFHCETVITDRDTAYNTIIRWLGMGGTNGKSKADIAEISR